MEVHARESGKGEHPKVIRRVARRPNSSQMRRRRIGVGVASSMFVSFCIPAHNEEGELPGTLRAIHGAAAGLNYEIVVADDASTDATASLARELGARVVTIGRRQIASARNAAAREAGGSVLFFVDADTRINAQAVTQALRLLDSGCVGGGGPMEFDGDVPAYARMSLPFVLLLFRVTRLTGGAFFFCTREAYLAAGGWDETLFASEEIAFAKALKHIGKFRLVRAKVTTSGRKMRLLLWRVIAGTLWRAIMSGGGTLRSREELDVWYGPGLRESARGGNAEPDSLEITSRPRETR